MQRTTKPSSLLATAIGGWLALVGTAFAATPVFINELHYDNAGTADIGEAVEVAGPAGTDLTGWTIALYNGSSSVRKVYDTIALSGPLPTSCGSAGVAVVYPAQIQNGGPDGLALVDAGGTVVQFLSYEGSFTAADGPASGMTSVDIGVSESGSTAVGQSLQLTGSGSNYEDFSWTGPVADSFGACNTGQSFGPAVDVPPTVASTNPADAATGVALAANVVIHFSEPVTLTNGWADLTCGNSGAHALAVSGNGADYTLDPDADFANNETCSVTVHAADVVDQDDTLDPMQADYTFSFTTVADLPPAVQSTVPADGSTAAVSSNLGVTFSEPVTLDSGWYTLACDQSGSHTATVSGGPVGYALDPGVDFTELESCTFTIVASAVHDLDGSIDAMAADVVVAFSIAGTGGDYYAGVDTSSGPALTAWLHNRIKDHHAYPYSGSGTNTWAILNAADQDPNNSANILDVYANQSLTKIPGGDGPYNREHTWPNSLGFPNSSINSKPNPPYTDGHMLHAANKGYNASRGNKPYANCDSGCSELGTEANDGHGGGGGGDSNWFKSPDGNSGSFEVWDYRKGNMARAVMYMAVRYKGGIDADGICEPDLRLTDNRGDIRIMNAQAASGCAGEANIAYMGLLTDLLAWNDQDPPDDQERLRNDVVYSFQDNRNPFVDHPEWARCVFLDEDCPAANDVIFADGFDTGAGTP